MACHYGVGWWKASLCIHKMATWDPGCCAQLPAVRKLPVSSSAHSWRTVRVALCICRVSHSNRALFTSLVCNLVVTSSMWMHMDHWSTTFPVPQGGCPQMAVGTSSTGHQARCSCYSASAALAQHSLPLMCISCLSAVSCASPVPV